MCDAVYETHGYQLPSWWRIRYIKSRAADGYLDVLHFGGMLTRAALNRLLGASWDDVHAFLLVIQWAGTCGLLVWGACVPIGITVGSNLGGTLQSTVPRPPLPGAGISSLLSSCVSVASSLLPAASEHFTFL